MTAYRMWVRKVEQGHRIRLDTMVTSVIPWLQSREPIECYSYIGAAGQLVVTVEDPVPSFAQKFDESVADNPSISRVLSENGLRFARFRASVWRVRFAIEAGRSRLSFIIPSEPRRLGLAPVAGDYAVLFSIKQALEIWTTKGWSEHLRTFSLAMPNVLDEIEEELG